MLEVLQKANMWLLENRAPFEHLFMQQYDIMRALNLTKELAPPQEAPQIAQEVLALTVSEVSQDVMDWRER